MTPNEQWRKIEEILNQATLLPVDQRIIYIDRICGGDSAELRAEVISLLNAYNESDEIFEQPIFPIVAELLDEQDDKILNESAFASYKAKKVLGRGGIGVVYLAEDTRLDRLVAVKMLHPTQTANSENVLRFHQEAKAASAISHQNVAHIYEFDKYEGIYFLAMEYVPGKTVRELIKEKQIDLRCAVEIALQVSYALEAAHREQIIHRDIKPENIMLTDSGLVKVLDFGLAKLGEKRRKDEGTSLETSPGMIMGTTAYMSPEQARGNSVDERTDLWSLGVVLYEMIGGTRPFDGETPVDIQAAILLKEPAPLDLNDKLPALNKIIQKALVKDVLQRYQSAKEITKDLRLLQRDVYDYLHLDEKQKSVGCIKPNSETFFDADKLDEHKISFNTPNTEKILNRGEPEKSLAASVQRLFGQKTLISVVSMSILLLVVALTLYQKTVVKAEPPLSVAVLPFTVENNSPDKVIAAQKLTQDLTFSLGRITDAQILSYNGVAAYDPASVDLSEAGEALQVDKVITGTIICSERANDLHLQITDLRNKKIVWEKNYSIKAQDYLKSHFQISMDIARELGNPKQIQNSAARTNYETYQLYLLARHHLNKRSTKDYEKAVENFKQAAIQDASFTDAYSGLAIAHILHGLNLYAGFGLSASRQSFSLANEAADQALKLDSNADEALTARAFINYRYKYNWRNAEADFNQAIAINPNNVLARHWYGEFLHKIGRFDEGFAQQKAALALEPHSARILEKIAQGYYLAHHFDEAVSYGKDALFIEKDNAALLYNISEIYEQKGDYKEAADMWKQAMILEEANAKWVKALEKSTQSNGYRGFARAKVEWLESLIENDYVYPTDLAKGYAALGEKDKAFGWLDKAIEARVPDLLSIGYSPAFDSLRGDPRFPAVLKQINFPQ